ncbi:hypothetical protein OJ253_2865 [Cryptosporidium canis]|uniref:Uncharacterized protein n=1 Tax=Cryptosporidium canis TaxID=195482 RepID=A0A9D5DEQ0_9CRYT|nr:hypothetical protein OJ253_2865 [Cryptosporidium canis]
MGIITNLSGWMLVCIMYTGRVGPDWPLAGTSSCYHLIDGLNLVDAANAWDSFSQCGDQVREEDGVHVPLHGLAGSRVNVGVLADYVDILGREDVVTALIFGRGLALVGDRLLVNDAIHDLVYHNVDGSAYGGRKVGVHVSIQTKMLRGDLGCLCVLVIDLVFGTAKYVPEHLADCAVEDEPVLFVDVSQARDNVRSAGVFFKDVIQASLSQVVDQLSESHIRYFVVHPDDEVRVGSPLLNEPGRRLVGEQHQLLNDRVGDGVAEEGRDIRGKPLE